ncbi:MAG: cytochrome c oxidase subunit 3 [Alphaproteobacteria bacterium]|nr:cytochrome c oxidase subunit 3 [Alphaproteobacteria bacterium]
MADTRKKHPYHLVDPSPWPFVASLSALLLTVGAVLFMHGHDKITLFIGLLMLLFTMGGWFRDIIKESRTEHTSKVKLGLRYGMMLFIASEVMFFVAIFWAYFDASIFPKEATGGVWPPKGILTLDPFELPYLNTLLLLLSGTTLTWSHHALIEGDKRMFLNQLLYTVLLGVVFLGVQVFEYMHAPFLFKGGIYPSTFYLATGFHGFHVFVGVVFLAVCWFRGRRGDFTPTDHFGFEAAAWYWHFVDVVWLFLFVSIYWWGGAN